MIILVKPLHNYGRHDWIVRFWAIWVILFPLAGFASPGRPTTQSSDAENIRRIVQELGDDDSKVRQHAMDVLAGAGEAVRPQLEAAAVGDDPEVRWRAQQLLDRLNRPQGDAEFAQQIIINNGQPIVIMNRGGQMAMFQMGDADNLGKYSADLEGQMAQARLTEQQRGMVRRQVLKIEQAKVETGMTSAPQYMNREQAYLSACDDLRNMLAELKLPDPGSALPPDGRHRLGVQIESTGTPDQPVVVSFVDDNSRGAKIGLQQGDAILQVNGQPIQTVEDLRTAVSDHDHLVLLIMRDGGNLTLTETPDQKSQIR